jgi:hypothetical protein
MGQEISTQTAIGGDSRREPPLCLEQVRVGARSREDDVITANSVDQEPVIRKMALPVADSFPLQRVVFLLPIRAPTVDQSSHGDAKNIHVVAAGLTPCEILSEDRSPDRFEWPPRRNQIPRSPKRSSALLDRMRSSPVSISRMA